MKIAFIQFNGMTMLDVIGFYDTVLRLPRFSTMDVSSDLCALTEEVRDEYGLVLKTQKDQPDLADYDLVFVPGGFGTRIFGRTTSYNSPKCIRIAGAVLSGNREIENSTRWRHCYWRWRIRFN